jgi:hypothetical protein
MEHAFIHYLMEPLVEEFSLITKKILGLDAFSK